MTILLKFFIIYWTVWSLLVSSNHHLCLLFRIFCFCQQAHYHKIFTFTDFESKYYTLHHSLALHFDLSRKQLMREWCRMPNGRTILSGTWLCLLVGNVLRGVCIIYVWLLPERLEFAIGAMFGHLDELWKCFSWLFNLDCTFNMLENGQSSFLLTVWMMVTLCCYILLIKAQLSFPCKIC